jgi:hypothetical protein
MKRGLIIEELFEHLPFTFFAGILAIILVGISYFLNFGVSFFESSFYIIHPAHIFVSAAASSAMFYRHKKNIFLGVVIGLFGAILIGTISDALIPFLGGSIIGINLSFHLPIFEEPFIILGVALLGSLLGIYSKISKMPHFIHVFLSVFASLFYLFSFGEITNVFVILGALIIAVIAVLSFCCFSDIIFPLFFIKKK